MSLKRQDSLANEDGLFCFLELMLDRSLVYIWFLSRPNYALKNLSYKT